MFSTWTLVFVSSDPAQDCILKQYSCLRRNMRMSGEPLVKFRPDNIAPWLSLDYYTVIWSNCGCSWLADGLTIKAGRLAKKPKNTVTSGGSSGVIKISSSFCSFPKSCKHKRAEEQSKNMFTDQYEKNVINNFKLSLSTCMTDEDCDRNAIKWS